MCFNFGEHVQLNKLKVCKNSNLLYSNFYTKTCVLTLVDTDQRRPNIKLMFY